MGMSHAYGPCNDNESLNTFDRAIELGCNFWDTADMYGADKNEILVGKALKNTSFKSISGYQSRQCNRLYNNISSRSGNCQCPSNRRWYTVIYPKICGIESATAGGGCHRSVLSSSSRPLVPIEESVSAMSDLVSQGNFQTLRFVIMLPEL